MNSRLIERVELGGFPQGSIPPPIEHTFYDEDGHPYAFTGTWVLGFSTSGPAALTGVVTLDPDTEGMLVYTWADGDMDTPGTYEGYLWASDDAATPSVTVYSSLFRWRVHPVPGFV